MSSKNAALKGESSELTAAARFANASLAYWLLGALFLPLFILIWRDRHTFGWDDAFYGATSISLYQVLRHDPSAWPAAMVHALRDRPPAICWLGQFFMPLGERLHYPQVALLLFVLLTQIASTLLLFCSLKKISRAAVPALLACFLVASGPLLTAMTYRYLVEPLQMFCVVLIVAVAAFQEELGLWLTGLAAVGCVAFGLLVKTSTPAFQFPVLLYIAYMLARRYRKKRDERKLSFQPLGLFLPIAAGTIVIAAATFAWYDVNYQTAMRHVVDATSDKLSTYYGSRGPLAAKLSYWGHEFQKAFFWPPLLIGLAVLLPVAFWKRRQTRATLGEADMLAGLSALWIAAILFLFARSVNEDTRYLLALGPYIGFVVAWLTAKLPASGLQFVLAAAIAIQFVLVTGQSYGFTKSSSLNDYLTATVTDKTAIHDAMFAALQTADSTQDQRTVVGVELPEFNPETLTFYSALQGHVFLGDWRYVGNDFTRDTQKNWQAILAGQTKYYVYYKGQMIDDPFNRLVKPMFDKVAHSSAMVFHPEKSNERVLVYEKAAHGRPRYTLLAANGLPLTANDTSVRAPREQGFQGVSETPGSPFGVLDSPKLESPVEETPALLVEGWAAASSGISKVQVLLDGKLMEEAALYSRPDVVRAVPTAKSTGFKASVDLKSVPDGIHKLSIAAFDLNGGSRTIALAPILTQYSFSGVNPEASLPFGLLEYPTKNLQTTKGEPFRVLGWTAGPTAITKVTILLDGARVVDASPMSRPDVVAAYPKLSTFPFEADIDTRNLPDGAHRISAVVSTKNGVARQFASVIFTLGSDFQSAGESKGLPFGFLDSPAKTSFAEGTNLLPVAGWAAGSSAISEIDVMLDGKLWEKLPTMARPDIVAALPRFKGLGFSDLLDLEAVSEGKHQFSVLVHCADGSAREICRRTFLRDIN